MRSILRVGLVALLASSSAHAAITFQFDYSYDVDGGAGSAPFFGDGSTARATLEAAGDFFESILSDSMSAIVPSGGNTWSQVFTDPETGATTTVDDPIVPADTIVVYVGARDLGSGVLGRAGPGGLGASGTLGWLDTVTMRGQASGEFSTWGGSLSVSNTAIWHEDYTTAPSAGENDLYSVLLHEIAHILGVGTSSQWTNLISGGEFTGAAATAAFGGSNVPLDPSGDHWANGTTSLVVGTAQSQEAAFDPSLLVGSRKHVTELDAAGIADLGWEVTSPVTPVPEAASDLLLLTSLAGWWGAVTVTRRRTR